MAEAAVPSEKLPKNERIARRRDFLRIYESGRKEVSRYAVVFASPNGLGHPRIGITATRKLGKAHVRNRIRRWVREVYRKRRGPLNLERESVDLVINIKQLARDATFRQFADDLTRLLGRFSPKP